MCSSRQLRQLRQLREIPEGLVTTTIILGSGSLLMQLQFGFLQFGTPSVFFAGSPEPDDVEALLPNTTLGSTV